MVRQHLLADGGNERNPGRGVALTTSEPLDAGTRRSVDLGARGLVQRSEQRAERGSERRHDAHVLRPVPEAVFDRDLGDADFVETCARTSGSISSLLDSANWPASRALAAPAAPARSAPARTPSPTDSALPEPRSRTRVGLLRAARGGSRAGRERIGHEHVAEAGDDRVDARVREVDLLHVHDPVLRIRRRRGDAPPRPSPARGRSRSREPPGRQPPR